jgi:hypothetical protein
MAESKLRLSKRLQRLGFTTGNQAKIYGVTVALVGQPLVISDDLVLVDATEQRSGTPRRLRVPRAIVNLAGAAR